MLKFNLPPRTENEIKYIKCAIDSGKTCGDGEFTKKCSEWIESKTGTEKTLLTTSCSSALDLSALLIGIKPGDEVIMPSYTFVSTANAFVLRGAHIVFVDIRPDTMNINENLIEAAITDKTKAVVPVHYAGVGCEMDAIMTIAAEHGIKVIEDAAQGVMASYNGTALGSIGDIGCFSFHETKNYSMGEGGAILLNDPAFIGDAEIIREKGTDRSKFLRGQVDKYSWVEAGSSFLPSDINAAYLWAQLEEAVGINEDRLKSWDIYFSGLEDLAARECIELPTIPGGCEHNAHMFYIKTRDMNERTALIKYLRENDIEAVFHYVPLHSSAGGKKYGRFNGEDIYTTKESERLLRLPMYYGIDENEIIRTLEVIRKFYKKCTR